MAGAEAMSSHGSRVGAAAGGGALSRQGSLCSLTFSEVDGGQLMHGVNLDDLLRSSGRKTADEVWRDIQGAAPACPLARAGPDDAGGLPVQRRRPARRRRRHGQGFRGPRLGAPAVPAGPGPGPAGGGAAGAGPPPPRRRASTRAAAARRGRRRSGPGRALPRRPGRRIGGPGEACRRRGRRGGEVQRAAQEADDQEPGVGGEVARAEAGVHERTGEQDLAAGGGERAAPEAQGTRAGSAVCAATGAEESAPAG